MSTNLIPTEYPDWTGAPDLEPSDPTRAYLWDDEEEEWVLTYPYLNKLGQEVGDPLPMAPPLGYNPQPSLSLQIREMVRSEKLRLEAEAAGAETFEESDDFDIGDDYDPHSPYENDFDPPLAEMVSEGKKEAARRAPPAQKPPVEGPQQTPAPEPKKD